MQVTLALVLSEKFSLAQSLHFLLYQDNPTNPIHGIRRALEDLPVVPMLPLVPMELIKNISQASKIVS